jgi:hypothetical protein
MVGNIQVDEIDLSMFPLGSKGQNESGVQIIG